MGNQYRALTKAAQGMWSPDVFEHEFTRWDEDDELRAGRLEIVPRPYRVLSSNYVVPEGEVFDAAFPVEIEAALIAGGHIERVRRDAKSTVEAPPEVEAAADPAPDPTPRKKASK